MYMSRVSARQVRADGRHEEEYYESEEECYDCDCDCHGCEHDEEEEEEEERGSTLIDDPERFVSPPVTIADSRNWPYANCSTGSKPSCGPSSKPP